MFSKRLVVAASALLTTALAYEGDGTFYGAGGNGVRGACFVQPGETGVGVTVAMNGAQFDGSCRRCVRITGTGEGNGGPGSTPILGPLYGVVDNECPECHYGDIDLGLNGDGRWHIQWDFVDCNEARSAGSNIPQPDGNAHWGYSNNGNKEVSLRGANKAALLENSTVPAGHFYLAPGYMVTSENKIALIADVVAANTAGHN